MEICHLLYIEEGENINVSLPSTTLDEVDNEMELVDEGYDGIDYWFWSEAKQIVRVAY